MSIQHNFHCVPCTLYAHTPTELCNLCHFFLSVAESVWKSLSHENHGLSYATIDWFSLFILAIFTLVLMKRPHQLLQWRYFTLCAVDFLGPNKTINGIKWKAIKMFNIRFSLCYWWCLLAFFYLSSFLRLYRFVFRFA